MRKMLLGCLIVIGLIIAGVLVVASLTPWMDRWGATEAEISAAFPGDGLVPDPASIVNRAVTINAGPEQIYPWIRQLGAGKGGYDSYSWFETNILRCEIINANRIHEEWQGLEVGDKVKMCPNESAPPAYTVALI